MAEIKVNGMSLSQIEDETLLNKLVNSTEDATLRKAIRARLQELKGSQRAGRRAEDGTDHREEIIQQRQKDAAASKARTLQMYDNMAKSGAAGDTKALDIDTYRGKPSSGKLLLSGTAIQKRDYVEETIRERVRASEEHKKRLLAAFDYAVKTQPAGTVRDVDFESFRNIDVSAFEQDVATGSATFQMSNGVPSLAKTNSSVPSTPVHNMKAPTFTQAQPQLDAYERALRQRQQEADDRKRRTLAAYDAIARSGVAGPKIVVREELEHMEIPEQEAPKPKFSCTSSFSGGYAQS